MSSDPVRYVGFAVMAGGREYQFSVAGASTAEAERIFTMGIAGANFRPGRLKFQEGPDIAMRKLRTVLAAPPGPFPLDLRQALSESDVTDYTAAGQHSARKPRFPPRSAG